MPVMIVKSSVITDDPTITDLLSTFAAACSGRLSSDAVRPVERGARL
jgi:hypothetical protein